MDTKKKFILKIQELEQFKFPLDELFSLQVNYNNVKYEFIIRFSSSNKNLICFGSGAYDRKKLSPPIYNRHYWQSEFEESVLYYNDPTLYIVPESPLKWNNSYLPLGWGVGKGNEWYLLVIADIIHILAKRNDITPENMLFFGSSGGGFTSIVLSTLIKNSAALVNNPQIFCRNLEDHFENIRITCFDNLDSETMLSRYGHRIDVIETFKYENYVPYITYIVNLNSEVDILDQFIPFINKLASLDEFNDQLKVLFYRNEDGHNGVIDKEKTIKLIKDHFKSASESIIENKDYLSSKKLYENKINEFKIKKAAKNRENNF